MPVKIYGIFTAYHPGTEFRYEGLGRYLATFVRHGAEDAGIRFVIACPSWSRKGLRELLKDAGVDEASYSFIGPERPPLSLSLYEWWQRFRERRWRVKVARPMGRFSRLVSNHAIWVMRRVSVTRNPVTFVAVGSYLALLGTLAAPFLVLRAVGRSAAGYPRSWWERLKPRVRDVVLRSMDVLRRVLRVAPEAQFRSRAFQLAHRSEVDALLARIKADDPVKAWYCPTAIWPAVARLDRPALICVPDVVLSEFPVAFSQIGGAPMAQVYDGILKTLEQGRSFVTYSQRMKWDMLVDRFGVEPDRIAVIPHAANRLDPLVAVSNFSDPEQASVSYCRTLVEAGLQKAAGAFPRDFHGTDFRFLFYASQLRPSKNVMTLLKAMRHLVKERYFGRKLVLTGDPSAMPEILEYATAHGLLNDILFLPGLTEPQLAAFYKLADLAVNPSLSEGGMPFTFTEAVSVGTPVVMGDIAVTREVLTDEDLRGETLFDPYDWRSMAARIEAALADREGLYRRQRGFFDQHLAGRTWTEVFREHMAIMDGLAAGPNNRTAAR
jgi:glycosyltransferase involved in cell wall biosynthesis